MSISIPTVATSGGDLPVIVYDSVFTDALATVTTDSEDATYIHDQALDWDPTTAWLPASSGEHYIQAQFAAPRAADCVFAYVPDVAENGGTVKVQSSDDGIAWTDQTAAITPTSVNPHVFVYFAEVSAYYWRFVVTSTPASFVPVAVIGERLQLPRGLPMNYALPSLSRDVDIDNLESVGGTFRARVVRRDGCQQDISVAYLDKSYARVTLLPFIKHAELLPFGWSPQPDKYPNEIALLWAERSIQPLTSDAWDRVKFTMQGRGTCNGQ